VGTVNTFGEITNDTANIANYNRGADWNGENGNLTTVGSGGSGSASFYGAFDMGGNVWELNDAVISGSFRGLRGGSWDFFEGYLGSSFRFDSDPGFVGNLVGFRVASP
jgi:formylglycine-generating enzyme required for sulfatase activity